TATGAFLGRRQRGDRRLRGGLARHLAPHVLCNGIAPRADSHGRHGSLGVRDCAAGADRGGTGDRRAGPHPMALATIKAERYPFVKAQFLLAAPHWLPKSSEQRRQHLQAALDQIHELDPRAARAWSQGLLPPPKSHPGSDQQPEVALLDALTLYFLEKRI